MTTPQTKPAVHNIPFLALTLPQGPFPSLSNQLFIAIDGGTPNLHQWSIAIFVKSGRRTRTFRHIVNYLGEEEKKIKVGRGRAVEG